MIQRCLDLVLFMRILDLSKSCVGFLGAIIDSGLLEVSVRGKL